MFQIIILCINLTLIQSPGILKTRIGFNFICLFTAIPVQVFFREQAFEFPIGYFYRGNTVTDRGVFRAFLAKILSAAVLQ